jgi:hypothetical protein
MPFLELFDETLDINSTGNYVLSIQVSPENLSYCLLDTLRNKYILLRSFNSVDNKYFTGESLSEIISKDDFLVKQYNRINIVLASSRFTLIPAPLYDPAKKEEYFSLNHTKDENNAILSNKLPEPDAFIVFAASKHIYEKSGLFFPSANLMHHIKPMLHHLSHTAKSYHGHYIHLHIENEFFNLFVFEGGLLKFGNSFNYRNVSDILYYVLNTYKSMNISNEEPVNFSGTTEKYDDIYSGFAMYLRNIRFTAPAGNFTFSYVFNDIELHRYLNLFNAVNCG